jgi:hypothetical protein
MQCCADDEGVVACPAEVASIRFELHRSACRINGASIGPDSVPGIMVYAAEFPVSAA